MKKYTGWKEIEITRAQDGKKERLVEKENVRTERDIYTLFAEFPVYHETDHAELEAAWSLAKKLAREYLKQAWLQDTMMVAYIKNDKKTGHRESIAVYKKVSML